MSHTAIVKPRIPHYNCATLDVFRRCTIAQNVESVIVIKDGATRTVLAHHDFVLKDGLPVAMLTVGPYARAG